MKKIVIFASGSGSNAENIVLHFKKNDQINVVAIVTNNPHAKVIDRAKNLNIPIFIYSKIDLFEGKVLEFLQQLNPDLIVLAGFLLRFPESIIDKFPNKIINIHPSLLPKYGGKGMYGMNVHQAVLDNKEKETGITIHFVNKNYDEGAIIEQFIINIEKCFTAEDIAEKVHKLEHKYFANVITNLL